MSSLSNYRVVVEAIYGFEKERYVDTFHDAMCYKRQFDEYCQKNHPGNEKKFGLIQKKRNGSFGEFYSDLTKEEMEAEQ